jgi:hypothetical protein
MNAQPTMTHTTALIGIAAALVRAKDEAAKAGYVRRAEFTALPEDGRVLWLPVEVVLGVVDGA